LVAIREPDKAPITLEQLRCIEEFYPELVNNIRNIKAGLSQDSSDDVIFKLGDSQEKEDIPDYLDSSPHPFNLVDSSDVELHAGSIDSIQRNADFIEF
jgi:hypothetical protein